MAYVFLAYGMHVCLNAITERAGRPGCVLIRALEPVVGLEAMARRRGVPAGSVAVANGPAKLTRALGITRRQNGSDLTRGPLTIARPTSRAAFSVATGPRVGITRATDLPLRFWIRDSRHASRPGAGTRRAGASRPATGRGGS
jgi:DNA-3-methyladenine glycosylase